MTIQFSKNPRISVRICTDLYRFARSAQHGKLYHLGVYLKHHEIDVETLTQVPCLSFISIQGRNQGNASLHSCLILLLQKQLSLLLEKTTNIGIIEIISTIHTLGGEVLFPRRFPFFFYFPFSMPRHKVQSTNSLYYNNYCNYINYLLHNPDKTMSSISSPGTHCWEQPAPPPPATRKYFLFLNKNISLIREYYLHVYT